MGKYGCLGLNRTPRRRFFLLVLVFFLWFHPVEIFAEENGVSSEKRLEIEQQLVQFEKEAEELDRHLQNVGEEKKTLANEVDGVNTEIKRREVEIKKLSLAISRANGEIKEKSDGIQTLSQKITKNRKALASSILFLYTYGQDNILLTLLKNRNLSDFLFTLDSVERVQGSFEDSLNDFKAEQDLLEKRKVELQNFQEEQAGLKALQEVERRLLAQKRKEKADLLDLTKGKESVFQQLLKSKKRDITTLKTQLFYLEKTGITAEDAIRYAELAAKRAGIRPAFLLALLEVETGKQFEDGVISVGTNVGTGNWKRDMYDCYVALRRKGTAEAEKSAFFKITERLGLDSDKMPVSRKPNYGCGGAMGPAQFIASTWLRFESKVTDLTGHSPPNPWNIEDAFTAAAVFLSEAGASSHTTAGELRAARTYISGNPNCSQYICKSYSSRIISLANDIARIL